MSKNFNFAHHACGHGCFLCSAELVRRPELIGKPVVVGGAGNRGVVAAASYEARSFGIIRLCQPFPQRSFALRQFSLETIHITQQLVTRSCKFFHRYTPLVEPISLDEAFLDVGGSQRLYGTPVEIAKAIRKDIRSEQGLSCSVGIAPNKFMAKLATEEAKPSPSESGPILWNRCHGDPS